MSEPTDIEARQEGERRVLLAIVTRPEPQASAWVSKLRARGVQAVACPLLVIGPAPDPAAVQGVMTSLCAPDSVMFVSPNAAAQFFACRPAHWRWPDGVQALATGPGTVAALLEAGVPEALIVAPPVASAQFDSETLWAQVCHQRWPGRRLWVVRGEGGRDWFSTMARAAGADVQWVQAYARSSPAANEALLHHLQGLHAMGPQAVWLLSSSEAVDHLEALLPGVSWAAGVAVASHPRISERAHALGMGCVLDVRPTVDAVVEAVSALQAKAPDTSALRHQCGAAAAPDLPVGGA